MYAVGHTSLTLISLSDSASQKVMERKNNSKNKFKTVFYRTCIKNEIWSFFEEYNEAKSFQILFGLDGPTG